MGNVFDIYAIFLEQVAIMGQNALNWLLGDIYIGAYYIGKPIYFIGGSLFFIMLVFWLKNKIFGDLG